MFDNDNSKKSSSIYYVNDKNDQLIVEVIDCSFKGKLSNDAKYIDDLILNKNSPKIRIIGCSFENKNEYAYNLNVIEIVENKKKFDINVIFAVTLGVALSTAIVIFAITRIIMNKSDDSLSK